MHELKFPYELSVSTDEESEYISDEIMSFNAHKVPFTQKETGLKRTSIYLCN